MSVLKRDPVSLPTDSQFLTRRMSRYSDRVGSAKIPRLRVLGTMPVANTKPIFTGLIHQLTHQTLAPSLTLDLTEAIDSTKSAELLTKLKPFRSWGRPLPIIRMPWLAATRWPVDSISTLTLRASAFGAMPSTGGVATLARR
jgi:hypothetical protein